MREILFRGKATNRDPDYYFRTDYKNGDWVYGLLTETENYMGFAEMTNTDGVSRIGVDKNTIGQYTGLIDKNGNLIFEGDIVEYARDEEIGLIAYHENEAMFVVEFDTWLTDFDHMYGKDLEIIGNIHDNPELLKGGAE